MTLLFVAYNMFYIIQIFFEFLVEKNVSLFNGLVCFSFLDINNHLPAYVIWLFLIEIKWT